MKFFTAYSYVFLFMIACSESLPGSSSAKKSTGDISLETENAVDDAFANFSSDDVAACRVWTNGYNPDGSLNYTPKNSVCQPDETPLVWSVTHENKDNTHFGDQNFNPNITDWMADFNLDDRGSWIKTALKRNKVGRLNFDMALDTMNFPDVTPSGRPNYDGFLFLGLNDLPSETSLGRNVCRVSFDHKVLAFETVADSEPNGLKAGARMMIGFALFWKEGGGRSNNVHFLEFNIEKTDGFHGEQKASCPKGVEGYDHCFYDPEGRYAEGQYYSLQNIPSKFLNTRGLPNGFQSTTIEMSEFMKSLGWFSKPQTWDEVKITPYYSLEVKGKNNIAVAYRNVDFSCTQAATANGQESTPQNGLFKIGEAAYIRTNGDYCVLKSGEHLRQCGYTQISYDNAPQSAEHYLTSLSFSGECPCGEPDSSQSSASSAGNTGNDSVSTPSLPSGFFRAGSAGAYLGNGKTYCSFNSGEQMKACGYSQKVYDEKAPLSTSILDSHKSDGVCKCGEKASGPMGLFKIGESGYLGNGHAYCSFPSGDALFSCGYSQSDYDSAPSLSDSVLYGLQNDGACKCP